MFRVILCPIYEFIIIAALCLVGVVGVWVGPPEGLDCTLVHYLEQVQTGRLVARVGLHAGAPLSELRWALLLGNSHSGGMEIVFSEAGGLGKWGT